MTIFKIIQIYLIINEYSFSIEEKYFSQQLEFKDNNFKLNNSEKEKENQTRILKEKGFLVTFQYYEMIDYRKRQQ